MRGSTLAAYLSALLLMTRSYLSKVALERLSDRATRFGTLPAFFTAFLTALLTPPVFRARTCLRRACSVSLPSSSPLSERNARRAHGVPGKETVEALRAPGRPI